MRLGHLSEAELTEYADGELAESRLSAVERHLRACPRCAEELARARSAVSLAAGIDAIQSPADLRRRVEAKAAGQPPLEVACRSALDLMHDHLDGLLSPPLVGALHRHLRACLHCRAECLALSAAVRLCRSLRAVAPPARIRQTLEAARLAAQAPTPWAARLRPAYAAAAAVALGALLVFARPGVRHPAGDGRPELAALPAAASTQPVLNQPAGEPAPEPVRLASAPEQPEPGEQYRPVAEPATELRRDRHADLGGAVKGPIPGPAAPAQAAPEAPLPAALRALRTVAKSAASEREAHHALALAGERFYTLQSESILARLPAAPAGDQAGAAEGAGDATRRPAQPTVPGPQEEASPGRASASPAVPVA